MLHIDAEISGVPKLAFLDDTPKRLFIDGKWVEARSGKTFTSFNPATGTYTGYDGKQHRCIAPQ